MGSSPSDPFFSENGKSESQRVQLGALSLAVAPFVCSVVDPEGVCVGGAPRPVVEIVALGTAFVQLTVVNEGQGTCFTIHRFAMLAASNRTICTIERKPIKNEDFFLV